MSQLTQYVAPYVPALFTPEYYRAHARAAAGVAAILAEAETADSDSGRSQKAIDWVRRFLAAEGNRRGQSAEHLQPAGPPLKNEPEIRQTFALARILRDRLAAGDYGLGGPEQLLREREALQFLKQYYSVRHQLYQVHNLLGAMSLLSAVQHAGGSILELGAGFGSSGLTAVNVLTQAGRLGAGLRYIVSDKFTERAQLAAQMISRAAPTLDVVPVAIDFDDDRMIDRIPDGDFHVVYSVDAFHHAHDVTAVLGGIRHRLGRGGRTIVVEPVTPAEDQPILQDLPHLCAGQESGYRTLQQWRDAFADAGFDGVTTFTNQAGPGDPLLCAVMVAQS